MVSPWVAEKKERTAKQAAKRLALLMTSARFFAENGFHETTLDDLARELGIGKGTLYHYVKSKNDILYEVQSLAIEQYAKAIEGARSGEGTVIDRIKTIMYAYAEIVTDDFGRCLVLNGIHSLDDRNRDEIVKSQLRITGTLRDLVAEGIEDGSIPPCDPLIACSVMGGAIINLAFWYKAEEHESLRQVVDGIQVVLLGGLEKKNDGRT